MSEFHVVDIRQMIWVTVGIAGGRAQDPRRTSRDSRRALISALLGALDIDDVIFAPLRLLLLSMK